ncbi:DNA/RNA non-specific endonuclease [Bizionia gelidisalsuginis]|uniref:Endonuclease n=1 Tax=Bizionia gelidisalsuginis TaxID=291188 RepID=A0ABY3MAT8_9FLAO|nr:DNA/RNA non-specific endonuclease [Bizionia gelidisalsuginis]TYC12872.1 DNA/RNA non-specific endonuclease [Bizionia gelidisalsuginis]
MSKKTMYSLLSALLLIAVYSYNLYVEHEVDRKKVSEGSVVKNGTNVNFLPTSTTQQVVHHQGYSLSYSEPHEQAEWVAYELKTSDLSTNNFKRPYFEIDYAVKTQAASWRNYKNSGYDRGHLCPAGDRRQSQFLFNETFLTSNITPQSHVFNAGVWNRLEQRVRYWAKRYNGVYVVTGGVLETGLKTIGNENVAVPNQFYKIVFDYNNGNPKLIAFLMPHEESNAALTQYVVTLDAVEKLTGIDFFNQLDDALEDKLEASVYYKNWKF